MNKRKNEKRWVRRRVFSAEVLEERALLAVTAQTFTGPSLSGLIAQAFQGKNTSVAAINLMVGALQTQLTSGPLADLNSGAVDGNGFVQEAQSLAASFDQDVDQQLLPHFVHIDTMLKLQGQMVVSDLISANQQESVGLIDDTGLATAAQTAIASLTAGPIHPLNTAISAYVSTTQTFETSLNTLVQTLSTTSTTPLTIPQVATTLTAEAEAYRADINAGSQVTHPQIATAVDTAVTTLETSAATIAADDSDSSTAQTDFTTAITAFDTAILDTTGLFGPQGTISQTVARLGFLPATPTSRSLPATTIGSVSGTASDGIATLTATLTSSTGGVVPGVTVSFTLDGAFAGVAVTDSTGVATLADVPTDDAAGTFSGAVFASFGGTASFKPSTGSGDLTVTQATATATTFSSVAGTAVFGGPATLTATLTSAATGAGVQGETVDFTLDGTAVGSAVTDANGLATLTGVATTAGVGTDTGGVVATFAGDSNFQASTDTGNLVVTAAPTALSSVAGSATFGGTATLTATLTSTATNQGIAGQTVNFTLDGTSVGPAVTDSNGVATLTGVATTDSAGTTTGNVVASYAGDGAHQAAANAAGNLVVSPAGTTLGAVSGTASFGGPATLVATLTSAVTGQGIADQTVAFTLDGNTVGTAVTNSSGVATFSGATSTDAVGTTPGAVVASYGGTSNFLAAANATGDLVVSTAPTALASVSGTATVGGTATLTATLTSTATGQGLANQTVSFSLDGTSLGTATTNASGVATLSGVATSDPVGTHTGAVTVSFAGTTNFGASAGTGNLVVSQSASSLSTVSGVSDFGGGATLTATLTSSQTNQGISGQTVDFTLDGASVGTATTNANGVATLTNVPTSDNVGTHTGAVVASYAGSTNFQAAANASGDLVVNQAGTSLSAVSGTAPVGGPATLLATLTSTVTGQGISGQTVSFTLDNVAVGTATTDANGLATLTGVPTSDPAGTDPGAVVASYAGTTSFQAAANASGDLVDS